MPGLIDAHVHAVAVDSALADISLRDGQGEHLTAKCATRARMETFTTM